MLGRLLVIGTVGLLMGDVVEVASAQSVRRLAVLVGVENYEHERLRSPKLKYPVEDVTEFGAILKEHGYEVTYLTDDEGANDPQRTPSKENIERVCTKILKVAKRSDTVVLAFAGHGLQFAGDKDAYFCPLDARPFAANKDSLVSLSKIYGELDSSFAGVKLILVDACRNDPDPTRGRSAGMDADSAPAPPKGVAALFSCSAGERAFENDALKHGVFFHYVIEGLRSEDLREKSGEIRFERLSSYVRDQVPTKVSEISGGREQSPNLKADIAGRPPVLLPSPIAKTTTLKLAEAKPAVKPEMKKEPADSEKSAALSKSTSRSAGDVQEFTDLKIKFCYCPPGKFLMGSPHEEVGRFDNEDDTAGRGGSQVEVKLSKGFWLAQTEVTQKQWFDLMGTRPWRRESGSVRPNVKEGDDFAATHISYEDALAFCDKITSLDRARGRLSATERYTLPTDAQWEYACRAGTTTRFSFGDDDSQLGEFAWYGGYGRGSASGEEYAHLVQQKKPNPWNLYDMHGNCWEWCLDRAGNKLTAGVDPVVTNGEKNVLRGGSWYSESRTLRSAHRDDGSFMNREFIIGFRLLRTE